MGEGGGEMIAPWWWWWWVQTIETESFQNKKKQLYIQPQCCLSNPPQEHRTSLSDWESSKTADSIDRRRDGRRWGVTANISKSSGLLLSLLHHHHHPQREAAAASASGARPLMPRLHPCAGPHCCCCCWRLVSGRRGGG